MKSNYQFQFQNIIPLNQIKNNLNSVISKFIPSFLSNSLSKIFSPESSAYIGLLNDNLSNDQYIIYCANKAEFDAINESNLDQYKSYKVQKNIKGINIETLDSKQCNINFQYEDNPVFGINSQGKFAPHANYKNRVLGLKFDGQSFSPIKLNSIYANNDFINQHYKNIQNKTELISHNIQPFNPLNGNNQIIQNNIILNFSDDAVGFITNNNIDNNGKLTINPISVNSLLNQEQYSGGFSLNDFMKEMVRPLLSDNQICKNFSMSSFPFILGSEKNNCYISCITQEGGLETVVRIDIKLSIQASSGQLLMNPNKVIRAKMTFDQEIINLKNPSENEMIVETKDNINYYRRSGSLNLGYKWNLAKSIEKENLDVQYSLSKSSNETIVSSCKDKECNQLKILNLNNNNEYSIITPNLNNFRPLSFPTEETTKTTTENTKTTGKTTNKETTEKTTFSGNNSTKFTTTNHQTMPMTSNAITPNYSTPLINGTDTQNNKDSNDAGKVAGIAIGSIFSLIILAGIGFFAWKKGRNKKRPTDVEMGKYIKDSGSESEEQYEIGSENEEDTVFDPNTISANKNPNGNKNNLDIKSHSNLYEFNKNIDKNNIINNLNQLISNINKYAENNKIIESELKNKFDFGLERSDNDQENLEYIKETFESFKKDQNNLKILYKLNKMIFHYLFFIKIFEQIDLISNQEKNKNQYFKDFLNYSYKESLNKSKNDKGLIGLYSIKNNKIYSYLDNIINNKDFTNKFIKERRQDEENFFVKNRVLLSELFSTSHLYIFYPDIFNGINQKKNSFDDTFSNFIEKIRKLKNNQLNYDQIIEDSFIDQKYDLNIEQLLDSLFLKNIFEKLDSSVNNKSLEFNDYNCVNNDNFIKNTLNFNKDHKKFFITKNDQKNDKIELLSNLYILYKLLTINSLINNLDNIKPNNNININTQSTQTKENKKIT